MSIDVLHQDHKLFDMSGMERNASIVGVLQRLVVGFAMLVHRVWPILR